MKGLTGKVAIVSGGFGDLGLATVERLLEEGCKVVAIDLKEPPAHLQHTNLRSFRLNILDEAATASLVTEVEQSWGPVNVLVNTAAAFIFKGVDATRAEWDQVLSVNVAGTSLLTGAFVPSMKKAGGGSIINFSSISGFVGQANFATYNATKFAIRGLTKCWAQDLAPFGIRVNTLCPGYIYTSAFIDSCKKLGLNINEENARASAMHLLNRQGKPSEVAAAAAFLASDESSFMTGSDLVVDGGYLAK